MSRPTFDKQHAIDFLTLVYLGVAGYIWIGMFEPERRGKFFSTTEKGIADAVRYAAELDHCHLPRGVYFRCSTIQDPNEIDRGKRGESIHTRHVPIFWADLDYGQEGHKRRKDQLPNPPDQDAVYRLIAEAGLVEPTVLIHSGGGLYPIWITTRGWNWRLDEAAETSELIQAWLEHASNAHGWHYGTGVGDLARVLRLPGSVNRKTDNLRPCRVIGGSGVPIHPSCWPKEAPEKPRTTRKQLPPRRGTDYVSDGTSVLDALTETSEWADILEPAGWTYVRTERDGWELWLRPGGADSEYSARCFEHAMVSWSDNAGLPVGKGQRLSKARVWAYFNHDDDLSAATIALLKGEYGDLPANVVDAVEAAREERDRKWVAENWPSTKVGTTWRKPTIDEYMADQEAIPVSVEPADRPADPAVDIGNADTDLGLFLDTYTRFSRPDMLGRRWAWMTNDGPSRLPTHARHLVGGVLSGHYPAAKALDTLTRAMRHHGVTQPAAPRELLASALAAVLNTETSS